VTGSLFLSPDLAVNASGSVVVAGTFQGTVDFDPGPKVKNASSLPARFAAFVLNLDTGGKFKWVTPFVGQAASSIGGSAFAASVALDQVGNVYVGGAYNGFVDFNPASGTTTLDSAGGAFVAKLNASGGLTWAKALVGGPSAYVNSIDVDALGNVYTAGYFRNSIDLNPGAAVVSRTSKGDVDVFVAKFTSAGNYSWGESFGGIGADVGYSVSVDAANHVHFAGYFSDEVDFDPSPSGARRLGTPGGSRNGFHVRLRQS
jgi:hypothetical protein